MDLDFIEDEGGISAPESLVGRQKTSLRMKYEAESRVFLAKFGGLENIRRNLGISQRKMSQLLMVDPSAWSRWIKDESKVPPHICRSLEWLLNLEGKSPDLMRVLTAGLMAPSRPGKTEDQGPLLARIAQLEQEIEGLKKKKLTEISKFMTLLIGLFALALLLILIK